MVLWFEKGGDVKHILIISNNPLSETSNNGKTLVSFLKGVNNISVRQLYFSSDLPDYQGSAMYFRVTENDVIRRKYGERVKSRKLLGSNGSKRNICFPRIDFLRLLRELLWLFYDINNDELNRWLSEEKIDCVLFCAGDSIFAYRFFEEITSRVNCLKVLYVTDDYVSPRQKNSIFSILKRKLVSIKMRRATKHCDQFITISEKMKNEYLTLFGVDSETFVNAPSLESSRCRDVGHPAEVRLVYAGGFHYNRWKSLANLLKAITSINNNKLFDKKIFLDIYSGQSLSKQQLDFFECKEFLNMKGFLERERLVDKLLEADALVHVEAFDLSSIESTRLSISTKIPEYLSSGRPVIAIGPPEIASIEHLTLKSNALVIDSPDIVSESFIDFIGALISGNSERYVTYVDTFESNYGLSKLLSRFTL